MSWPRPLLLLLLLVSASCRPSEISLADAGIPDIVCQKTYSVGENSFWVNKVVDAVGRSKEVSARWRSPSAELGWLIRDEGPWFDHPTEVNVQMRFDTFDGEAVSTRLYADGLLIDERNQLGRRQTRSRPKWAAVLLPVSFHAPRKVPRLHGVRDLRMKAVLPDGRVVAEAALPLPDWALLDLHAEEGRREVERLAQSVATLGEPIAAGCEQLTGGDI